MATGGTTPSTRILTSTSSALRLQHAATFLRDASPDQDVLVVAASRGAADDLARRASTRRGATVGWHRFSVLQLAARLSLDQLAASGRLPGSPLGAEAVASRAIFGAIADGSLRYFSPVAQTPGFPRAVARTIGELRLAGVPAAAMAVHPPGGPDLATLLAYIERELADAGAADRTLLLASATDALNQRTAIAAQLVAGRRLLLLDPALTSEGELRFVAALAAAAAETLMTLPAGDTDTAAGVAARCGGTLEALHEPPEGGLGRLRTHIFQADVSPSTRPAGQRARVLRARRGARSGRDRATCPCPRATRRALRPDGRAGPRAAAVPGTAGTCAGACRRASLVRAGHQAARSGRSRDAGIALLRRRGVVGPPLCRVSLTGSSARSPRADTARGACRARRRGAGGRCD